MKHWGWVVKMAWIIPCLLVATWFLAPAPLPAAAQSSSFPEWVNFYGINSTWNGEPLPPGSEVVAYAGSNRCGSFVVHTTGQYGLMPCYRSRTDQPGAEPGDRIRFTVNGYEAILRGPDEPIWTTNGDRKHVELEASGAPLTPSPTPTQTVLTTSTPTGTPVVPFTPTPTWLAPPSVTSTIPPFITPTLTPSPTGRPWETCREEVRDGGFEIGGFWTIEPASRPAARSAAVVRSGYNSMRLGIVEEANALSTSAVRQRVEVPAQATSAMLTFYYYPVSEPNPAGNYWEVMLLEPGTTQELGTLWRGAMGNERRWLMMNVDLSAFRGRTFDLFFNVFNDGAGGRSAIFLDDITFQVCWPEQIILTPTPTPLVPSTPFFTPTPYPTPAGACQELIANGSFLNGIGGWELGQTARVPVLVTEPRRSGSHAMQLGFLDGANLTTYSSIRQSVSIPADVLSAEITFWTYLMSGASAGQDHQEFVILSPVDNSTRALPWRVINDNSRTWTQQRVDLMPYRGQTIVVYFNAYNDGYGGSTAMVIDDVSLLACRHVQPTPTPVPAWGGTVTSVVGTPIATSAWMSPTVESLVTGTATATTAISFARPTPTVIVRATSTGPNPGLIAGIAILVAIGIAVLVLLVVRGGGGSGGGAAGGGSPEPPPVGPAPGSGSHEAGPSASALSPADPWDDVEFTPDEPPAGKPSFRHEKRTAHAVSSVDGGFTTATFHGPPVQSSPLPKGATTRQVKWDKDVDDGDDENMDGAPASVDEGIEAESASSLIEGGPAEPAMALDGNGATDEPSPLDDEGDGWDDKPDAPPWEEKQSGPPTPSESVR